jgi:hypothetical protein
MRETGMGERSAAMLLQQVLEARGLIVTTGRTAHVGARVGRGPLLTSEACNLQLDETVGRRVLELKDANLSDLDDLEPCLRCCLPALEA